MIPSYPPDGSVPYNRLLSAVGQRRGNAVFLQKSAGLNPFRNIELSEMPKITEIAQELFVQRDEFAIFEEKVAKKS